MGVRIGLYALLLQLKAAASSLLLASMIADSRRVAQTRHAGATRCRGIEVCGLERLGLQRLHRQVGRDFELVLRWLLWPFKATVSEEPLLCAAIS
jgi:hypothetical protein